MVRPEQEKFYATTDLGNMHLFVEKLARDRLRFVKEWGWLLWDSRRWKRDRTGAAMRLAKLIPGSWYEAAQIANGMGLSDASKDYAIWGAKSEAKSKLENALELAKTDLELVSVPEEFDNDDMLFNTPSGTIHLQIGIRLGHDQRDLITKLSNALYNPEAPAPRWTRFLERILPDEEVRAYIQRAVGYSLTGGTQEQCLFLLHGPGANGKSTFLSVLSHVLGDYAVHARPETFMVQDKESIPNDVAALAGARMVITTETEDSQRLAESLVKRMTGGDKLTARFLHQEYFEFTPKFKLWIAANHLPQIRGTDYAIWRRIHLVPFTQTIPAEEQDPYLVDELKQESAGILAWALKGCMEWQETRLTPPQAVVAAVEQYRSEQDVLGAFISDCCVLGRTVTTTKAALFAAYQTWCEENNERPWSQTRFSLRLQERPGVKEERAGGTGKRSWAGIGLRTAAASSSAAGS